MYLALIPYDLYYFDNANCSLKFSVLELLVRNIVSSPVLFTRS